MNAVLGMGASLVALLLSAPGSYAQDIDPDVFSNRSAFTEEPFLVREAQLSSGDVAGQWPFRRDQGDVMCLTVDGIPMAMFETPDAERSPGEEPFLLHDNMFMLFIGRAISRNDHLKDNLDPATIGSVLANVYHAALRKCGSPYSQ
jgi:hypothetical protein